MKSETCTICLSKIHFTIKIRNRYNNHSRFYNNFFLSQPVACRASLVKAKHANKHELIACFIVPYVYWSFSRQLTAPDKVLRRGEVNTGMKCLTITSSCQIAINFLHGQQNYLNGRRNYRLINTESVSHSVSQ